MPGLRVLPAVESRPPGVTWFDAAGPPVEPVGQPSLLDLPDPPGEPDPGPFRGTVTAVGWQATPDPRLPDAVAWSSSLALAAVEVTRRRRPIGQLSRWVTEELLDYLSALAHRPRRDPAGSAARVQSARVQFPTAGIAESAVHLRIGPRSVAAAIRLDAVYHRWLATALELG